MKIVQKATLSMTPVSERVIPTLMTAAELCVSFVVQDNSDKEDSGVIVAVDPGIWTICRDDSDFVLIDPCGNTGYVLLYIPCNTDNVVSRGNSVKEILCVDKDGKPYIHKVSEALANATALGISLKSTFKKAWLEHSSAIQKDDKDE